MARAGRSRRSLLHPQPAAIGLRLSLCTLAGNRAPTAGPRDRTREKKQSGRGPVALASTPETLPAHPRPAQRCASPPSIMQPAARCRRARMCYATPAPNPLRPHPLHLPRLGREGASSAGQPGVSSPSPPALDATPHRVFFPSVGWVRVFTLVRQVKRTG